MIIFYVLSVVVVMWLSHCCNDVLRTVFMDRQGISGELLMYHWTWSHRGLWYSKWVLFFRSTKHTIGYFEVFHIQTDVRLFFMKLCCYLDMILSMSGCCQYCNVKPSVNQHSVIQAFDWNTFPLSSFCISTIFFHRCMFFPFICLCYFMSFIYANNIWPSQDTWVVCTVFQLKSQHDYLEKFL